MTDFDVLMQMGFSRENIKYALSATQGHSMDEAIDLLLDHKLDVECSGDVEKKVDRPANGTEVFHAKVSLQNAPSSDTGAKRTKRYTKTRSKRKLKHSNSMSILGSYKSKLPTIQEEEGTEQNFSTTEVYQVPTNSKGTNTTTTPTPTSKGHKTIRKCSDCGKSCSRKIQSEYHTFRTGHEHFIEVPKPRKSRTHKQKALVKEATRAAQELSQEILVTSEFLKSLESGTEPESAEPETAAAEVPNKQTSYTFTRIQLRLLDGQTMNATFLSTDPLGSLREFVDKHTSTKHDYDLITAFPRRTFTADDYSKTFLELGLIPTIVIIMTKKH